jgi:SAM-dependent methyltransferase
MKPPQLPVEPGALMPYRAPEAYTRRAAARKDDVDYYVALGRRVKGPVLECGAGNGRVTLPLARAGVRVTAVDWSPPMLDDLRSRLQKEPPAVRRRVAVVCADMRALDLKRRFAMVMAPFDTCSHLYNRSDFEAFLEGVRRHLALRSKLVFDVSLLLPRECLRPGLEYDAMAQVSRCFVDASGAVELAQRHYLPEELRVLLDNNGFSHIRLTADFTARALHGRARSIVISARRR